MSSEVEQTTIKLKSGINLNDLTTTGTTFEVNFDDLDFTEDQLSYQPEEVYEYTNPNCCGVFEDEDTYNEEPFENLARKMKNITEDGKIKKRIIREGYGASIPDLSHVTIGFNAYLEFNDEPFDSTYARKKPFTFRLKEGNALPGVDFAVSTMKLNEKAQFLIAPEYAYGQLGCLERVPPNATILFEIEVKNVVDSGAIINYSKLDEESQKNFDQTYTYSTGNLEAGNALYKKNLLKEALKKYNIAVSALERCALRDAADEERQQQLLLRLYGNLILLYSKLKYPGKACQNFNKLNKMCVGTSLKISAKAHFHHGKALMMLSDYSRAEKQLKIARNLEPQNSEISRELLNLEAIKLEHKQREITMAKALLSNSGKDRVLK